jgi:hypothetical protein
MKPTRLASALLAFGALTFGVLAAPVSAQENEISEEAARAAADDVAEQCTQPEAPTVPDGNTAEESVLAEAGAEVRQFVSDTQSFLACLEQKEASYGEEITDAEQAVVNAIYNNSVEAMQAAADAYNEAVRAFKARSER